MPVNPRTPGLEHLKAVLRVRPRVPNRDHEGGNTHKPAIC
jgi:hypothetical protein